MLSCKSTIDSDVVRGKKRFWTKRELTMARKLWKEVKDFGIRGYESENIYVKVIEEMEARDQ